NFFLIVLLHCVQFSFSLCLQFCSALRLCPGHTFRLKLCRASGVLRCLASGDFPIALLRLLDQSLLLQALLFFLTALLQFPGSGCSFCCLLLRQQLRFLSLLLFLGLGLTDTLCLISTLYVRISLI